MNAVVLQVRPTADAFWPSPFEPWSKYLTGTQGRSPGYDPLKFAVEAAHRRGKLHDNQGVPAARRYVEDAILHAVRNYDIDAVHCDDYFYPYPVEGDTFRDGRAFQQYGDGFPDTPQGRADWRRRNINLLVSELDQPIARIEP